MMMMMSLIDLRVNNAVSFACVFKITFDESASVKIKTTISKLKKKFKYMYCSPLLRISFSLSPSIEKIERFIKKSMMLMTFMLHCAMSTT